MHEEAIQEKVGLIRSRLHRAHVATGKSTGELAAEVGLPAGAWRVPPPEGRDSRLPPQIEEARARLIAALRERWRG